MDQDRHNDEASRNASRRRAVKQERALYQPGKGLPGNRDNNSFSTGRKDETKNVKPAPASGRNNPMDLVQEKLKEMSMRGPPPDILRRYSNNSDHHSGGGDSRFSRGNYRGRNNDDFRRYPPRIESRNIDSDWRSGRRSPQRDNRRWNQNGSIAGSRESLQGSVRNMGYRRDSTSSQLSSSGPASWAASGGDRDQRNWGNSRNSNAGQDFSQNKRQLWRDTDSRSQNDRRDRDQGNQNRREPPPIRQRPPQNNRGFNGPRSDYERDQAPSERRFNSQEPSSSYQKVEKQKPDPENPTDSDKPLEFIDPEENGTDAEVEKINETTAATSTSSTRIDWSECPTPPPLEIDEPISSQPAEPLSSSSFGCENPPRRRLDSETSNWSQQSGRSRNGRRDRRNRDRSWDNGNRGHTGRPHHSPRSNIIRDRRPPEQLPPRFQRQREAQRKLLEANNAISQWQRKETTQPSEDRGFVAPMAREPPLIDRKSVPEFKNDSVQDKPQKKPLMTVRPLPQVLDDSNTSRSMQRQLKDAIEKNLQEAQQLELELSSVLAKAAKTTGGIQELADLRSKIQLRYEHVVLNDPRFSVDKNIESLLWKAVYHQVIEALRREEDYGGRPLEEIRSEICTIVDEGLTYYETLVEKLQERQGFKLDQFLQAEKPHHMVVSGTRKMIVISAQKMLICLGDLCRYREQALDSANFGKARDYYLQAQQLAPKNGKPYNQLALLAVYSRRKLDAVYYYMRSLAASNPFLTAKESLTTLFDEIRKKCEAMDKIRKQNEESKTKALLALPEQARCEIWIRPDGSSWQKRGDSETDNKLDMIEQLNAMSDYDLNKQFTLSFLHVHGKLFSKIGMDHFGDAAKQMLLELRCLLRRPIGPGGGARYLQLLAICMFSVSNNSLKHAASLDSNARSLMQELSIQIAMAFVTHLMERCTERIDEHLRHKAESDPLTFPEDVEELLQVLKIWTDWMSGHKQLWCPPPLTCEFPTSTKADVWSALAELLTAFTRAEVTDKKVFSSNRTSKESMEVTLSEDTAMAGFVPLFGAPVDLFFTEPYRSDEVQKLRTQLRVSRLQFFGDYLCGLKEPYLSFNVQKNSYESLIIDNGSDRSADGDDNVEYESQTGSSVPSEDEDRAADVISEEENSTSEVEKLRRRKLCLQKRMQRQNRFQAYIERVLHNNRGTTILEIRPRYLIPDTNCLVDHLEFIQRLVSCKTFSIYIPIVVVNELDGLARGTKNSSGARAHQDPEHAARVTAFAQDALDYLRQKFAAREPKLRTITSRGNLLDSLSFRTETGTETGGNNDDLILACAVSLCKEQQLQPGETEAPLKLFREAVLLTEDRNLAVKAIAHNVPVRDLISFVRWAQVPQAVDQI